MIEEARRQGAPTLAITNQPDSPLAAAAEFVLPTPRRPGAQRRRDQDLHRPGARPGDAQRGPARGGRRGRYGRALGGAGDRPGCGRRHARPRRRDRAARRALPLPRPADHQRARLLLRHRLRVGAQAEGDQLPARRTLLAGRLPARPGRDRRRRASRPCLVAPSGATFDDMLAFAGHVARPRRRTDRHQRPRRSARSGAHAAAPAAPAARMARAAAGDRPRSIAGAAPRAAPRGSTPTARAG